jgi:dihydrodipicolinate synthase/N-acetylneuraminate lyase
MDAGIDGIILGGTLGESSVLSTDEKEKLVKFAIEKVAGKIPVMIFYRTLRNNSFNKFNTCIGF